MSDKKRDAIEMLDELRELTILDEADPQAFRVRAYESARHALEAYPGDPSSLTLAQLQKLDGIGKSTATKLRELFDGQKVEKLEALRAKYPRALVDLMRIPGVGPKAVRRLRTELGVENVDDLRAAVAAHKIRDLKGFGQKTEDNLAKTLAKLAALGGEKRTPISVALPLAERIVAELGALPGVVKAAYCGSLRRFSETVGDLDIVVATAAPAGPIMAHVAAMSMVETVLGSGDTKTSVVTRRGLQIDVRVVKPEQLGAALMYFTGSKSHNIKLRQRAIERGWTLNEYALAETDGGKVIASETEEDIYRALGLAWIHPVLREDAGEIDRAEKGTLPVVLGDLPLGGDFHVHTDLSGDGHADLADVVRAAMARGYSVLAITEHAENLTMNGVGREALLAQRAKIAALQAEVGPSIKLLHGIELNIGKDGGLDYDAEFRAAFDFCLASIHDYLDLDREAQTQRILAAMADPTVQMIGHLSARMIGGRPPIDLDIEAVLAGAERTGTALEINGGLPRLDASLDVIRAARGRAIDFVLTSDAHKTDELDRLGFAALHATKAWLDPARLVNTWSQEKMLSWSRAKRSRLQV